MDADEHCRLRVHSSSLVPAWLTQMPLAIVTEGCGHLCLSASVLNTVGIWSFSPLTLIICENKLILGIGKAERWRYLHCELHSGSNESPQLYAENLFQHENFSVVLFYHPWASSEMPTTEWVCRAEEGKCEAV